MNQTITVTCPNQNIPFTIRTEGSPDQDVEGPCGGENEIEITFGWDAGQKGGWSEWNGGTEPIAAGVCDVEAPQTTCEWCGYEFTDQDLAKIETEFTPDPYEPPTREDFAESDARYAAEYADEDTDQ